MNDKPPRLPRMSGSKAGVWLDCQRAYYFAYVAYPRPVRHRGGRPLGEPAHLTLGNVAHNCLAEWMTYDPAMRTPAALASLVALKWPGGTAADDDKAYRNGFRDAAHEAEWIAHLAAMLAAYAPTAAVVEARGIERNVEFPVREFGTPFIAHGRIDRLDRRVDPDTGQPRLVVVDYKAGRRPITDDDAATSPALALYVYVVARTLSPSRGGRPAEWCTRAELHHLRTGDVAAADYDRARIERHLSRLAVIVRETSEALALWDDNRQGLAGADLDDVRDAVYPPKPGPLCAGCDWRHLCPEGQVARPPVEPWTYLDTPEPPATT